MTSTTAGSSPSDSLRNGLLFFAGGMVLAAVSFVAEHYFMKVARKVEEEL